MQFPVWNSILRQLSIRFPYLKNYQQLYIQISQSRSLISVYWSPKNTEILLNMSDLDLRSLLYNGISKFFGLQYTEIKDRDCEILKEYPATLELLSMINLKIKQTRNSSTIFTTNVILSNYNFVISPFPSKALKVKMKCFLNNLAEDYWDNLRI